MLTMAESPNATTSAVLQSSDHRSSTSLQELETKTAIRVKRESSPKSPVQKSIYQKRTGRRQKPYSDHSPGGSTCSSDDSNGESDDSEFTRQLEQRKVKRMAANTRERKRMHTVNSAFEQLRELVPTYPSNRKLSKIDTLRLACTYIQDLVSLLHGNTQGIQGDDCTLYHPIPDGFLLNGYSGLNMKTEVQGDYQSFSQYRMQPSFIASASDCASSDYSASESDNHSPPYFAAHTQNCTPGIGVRPPPLTRTSSDSVALYGRMIPENANSQGCQTQRQMNIPSPLATCTYTHTSQQNTLASTPAVLSSGHQPPPTWQRTGSVPNGYTVYRQ